MLDIMNRLLEAKKSSQGVPLDQEAIIPVMDKKWLTAIRTKSSFTLSRLRKAHADGSKTIAEIFLSKNPADRETINAFIEAIARTEYREGFVLGTHLCCATGETVELEHLSWYPPEISRVLPQRARPGKAAGHLGVCYNGKIYSCVDMDRVRHTSYNEMDIHFLYIQQRRDFLLPYVELLGDRPKVFLKAKVDHLTHSLETRTPVTHF